MPRFLSTLSLRRATVKFSVSSSVISDFYPRSPCGERQTRRDSRQQPAGISIHALLAESDRTPTTVVTLICISIHALLAESDTVMNNIILVPGKFLSTLSLRRATVTTADKEARKRLISIHALLAESDAKNTSIAGRITSFLSTLSLRRATDFAA